MPSQDSALVQPRMCCSRSRSCSACSQPASQPASTHREAVGLGSGQPQLRPQRRHLLLVALQHVMARGQLLAHVAHHGVRQQRGAGAVAGAQQAPGAGVLQVLLLLLLGGLQQWVGKGSWCEHSAGGCQWPCMCVHSAQCSAVARWLGDWRQMADEVMK